MGIKKLNQASSIKIFKNQRKRRRNYHVGSLRPQVYITDTSNFKMLVQGLTGNYASTISSSCSSPAQSSQNDVGVLNHGNHGTYSNMSAWMNQTGDDVYADVIASLLFDFEGYMHSNSSLLLC
ncbi:hypothetical protein M5689_015052 [Euphorbia peplus]|nr:hypothetical protein M5689_015052 [Euphorbia peplus]